jgi:hypothetical protein
LAATRHPRPGVRTAVHVPPASAHYCSVRGRKCATMPPYTLATTLARPDTSMPLPETDTRVVSASTHAEAVRVSAAPLQLVCACARRGCAFTLATNATRAPAVRRTHPHLAARARRRVESPSRSQRPPHTLATPAALPRNGGRTPSHGGPCHTRNRNRSHRRPRSPTPRVPTGRWSQRVPTAPPRAARPPACWRVLSHARWCRVRAARAADTPMAPI